MAHLMWKLEWAYIRSTLLERFLAWRVHWWNMFGYPDWPSLDAWQAAKLGLTPIYVRDSEGNAINQVFSVDFQSGEVVIGTGRLVNYQGEQEPERVSRFFKKIEFYPEHRMVNCINVYRGNDHHGVRKGG